MIHPLSFRFMGIETTTEGQEQPKRTAEKNKGE